MPKALHDKLKREVNRKHPNWSKERKNKYIYGTMQKTTDWKPSHQKKKHKKKK